MFTNTNENKVGFGDKLMFFMIGGGLGAAAALLFAPKPGRELRQDIAEAVRSGYDETLDAANCVKERSLEYLSAAEEKGGEMIEAFVDKATAARNEITEDAEKVSELMSGAAERVTETVKPRHIF